MQENTSRQTDRQLNQLCYGVHATLSVQSKASLYRCEKKSFIYFAEEKFNAAIKSTMKIFHARRTGNRRSTPLKTSIQLLNYFFRSLFYRQILEFIVNVRHRHRERRSPAENALSGLAEFFKYLLYDLRCCTKIVYVMSRQCTAHYRSLIE